MVDCMVKVGLGLQHYSLHDHISNTPFFLFFSDSLDMFAALAYLCFFLSSCLSWFAWGLLTCGGMLPFPTLYCVALNMFLPSCGGEKQPWKYILLIPRLCLDMAMVIAMLIQAST